MEKRILIITGPTGSGKSELAMLLAQETPAVIINADSMQIYREIPIITAQPTEDEKKQVPHALYGTLPASERCSVILWTKLVIPEIEKAWKQKKLPVLTGGTGLYLKHLMHGISPIPETEEPTRKKVREIFDEMGREAFFAELKKRDPEITEKLDPGNTQRILRAYEVVEQTNIPLSEWQKKEAKPHFPLAYFKGVAFTPPREKIYEKVNHRFKTMVEQGALEEVKALMKQKLDPSLPAMKAHGVPELIAYHEKRMSLEAAITQAQLNTRHYIKRQLTWLRHQMPELQGFEERKSALKALLTYC